MNINQILDKLLTLLGRDGVGHMRALCGRIRSIHKEGAQWN